MTCFDLKLHWPIISDFRDFGRESADARRQVGVLAIDGLSSVAPVRYVRPAVWWRSQDQDVPLQRTSAGHGLRAAHLSGKLRNVETCLRAVKTKWYHMGLRGGISRNNLSNANRERDWRIYADFAQVLIHEARVAVRRGRLGHRFGGHRLRARRLHDRPLPVDVPLGPLSPDQGGHQAAHAPQSSRQHPRIYPDFRRKTARCERLGLLGSHAWRVLRHGPRVPRLRSSLSTPSSQGVLRHPGQEELYLPAALLPRGRQSVWRPVRPDGGLANVLLRFKAIPSRCVGFVTTTSRSTSGWCF